MLREFLQIRSDQGISAIPSLGDLDAGDLRMGRRRLMARLFLLHSRGIISYTTEKTRVWENALKKALPDASLEDSVEILGFPGRNMDSGKPAKDREISSMRPGRYTKIPNTSTSAAL
jgi:hypothetical protein